jgi:hypothetical protein
MASTASLPPPFYYQIIAILRLYNSRLEGERFERYPLKGISVSPFQGFFHADASPGLAPWADLRRRFAAFNF